MPMCINQGDHEERASQVALMGRVYSLAREVFAYLGEPSPYFQQSTYLMFHYLAWMGDLVESQKGKQLENNYVFHHSLRSQIAEMAGENATPESLTATTDRITQGLFGIINRPFFSRRWIVQEVTLAQKVTMLIGDIQLPWQALWCVATMLNQQFEIAKSWNDAGNYWVYAGPITRTLLLFRLTEETATERSLWNVFRYCTGLQATEPKDHLYALLGLATDSARYPRPDYSESKTTNDVHLDFCRQFVRDGHGIDLIVAACGIRSEERDQTLPSWAPRLDKVDYSRFSDEADTHRVSAKTEGRVRLTECGLSLTTCGAVFDEITEIGPPGPTTSRADIVSVPEARDIRYRLHSLLEFLRLVAGRSCSAEADLAMLLCQNCKWMDVPDEWFGGPVGIGPTGRNLNPYTIFPEALSKFLGRLGATAADISLAPVNKQFEHGHIYAVYSFDQKVLGTFIERRVFVTKGGRIGIARNSIAKGDMIAVFAGGAMPFVIRSQESGYKLIEWAYVQGVMKGELFQQDFDLALDNLSII